jgi:hypothetical protein
VSDWRKSDTAVRPSDAATVPAVGEEIDGRDAATGG